MTLFIVGSCKSHVWKPEKKTLYRKWNSLSSKNILINIFHSGLHF